LANANFGTEVAATSSSDATDQEAEQVLGADDQHPTVERIAALGYTTQVV
jgi:hypothetical protein